jgi:hypothetical protein
VLDIQIIDLSLTDSLLRQAVDVLEQQQADDETALDRRLTLLRIEGPDLAIIPVPLDLAAKLRALPHSSGGAMSNIFTSLRKWKTRRTR